MVSLSPGQKIEFDALVTKTYFSKFGNSFKVTDGSYEFSLSSSGSFSSGDVLHIIAVVEDVAEFKLKDEASKKYSDHEEGAKAKKQIYEKLIAGISLEDKKLLLSDELTEKLKSKIYEVAKHLLAAQKLGRYILLRFHSDADGISGAFALTKFLRCNAMQQNSAVYSEKDAIRDLSLIHHENSPLIILLDFGAGKESEYALKLLKAAGIELIIIDHHPPIDNVSQYASIFLSPWAVSHDASISKYPAGYLACEVANAAITDEGLLELAAISCAGDKSDVLLVTQNDKDKSLVLDYLAIHSAYGNNLSFYRSVLGNSDLFNSIQQQAKEKILNMVTSVKRSMKEYNYNGLKVYTAEVERASKESEFPSRGKVTTYIYESFGQDKPVVVLGYGNRSIMFRINDLALQRGVSADRIIEKLKGTMKDFIDGGGGHAKAAAVKVREGFTDSVLDAILKEIERIAQE